VVATMRRTWGLSDSFGATAVFASLILSVAMAGAVAGPIEDSTFSAFEAFCIWPINKPDQIAAMVQDIGATPLNEQEARPFLNAEPGRAWGMRDKNARLVIILTNEGVCRVFGADASGEAVENLVGQHLRSIKLSSNKLGSEITNTFAVTYPDPAGGADLHLVVSIQRSALATVTGAWLVAVPERLIAKDFSNIPRWP
jgi:hypothetical protein